MKKIFYTLGVFIIIIFTFCVVNTIKNENTIQTNGGLIETLSNKKIEWGIKRKENHEQPDLGSLNKRIIDDAKGIAIGNKESKKVYLTFDEGYEAGYTENILNILKENNVPAAFFITAHYVNTASELVQRMINEGHIVGNHISVKPMYLKEKSYES